MDSRTLDSWTLDSWTLESQLGHWIPGLWIPGHWIPGTLDSPAYMKGLIIPPTIEVRHQVLGLFSPLGLNRLTASFVTLPLLSRHQVLSLFSPLGLNRLNGSFVAEVTFFDFISSVKDPRRAPRADAPISPPYQAIQVDKIIIKQLMLNTLILYRALRIK